MPEIPYQDKKFRLACRIKLEKPGKKLPDNQFDRFMFEAEARGLNPLLGHLWIQVRHDSGSNTDTYTFETTIDGLRFVATNTGEFAGFDETKFQYENTEDGERIKSASVTVYRFQHGNRIPYPGIAFFEEYVQRDRNRKIISMWRQMGRHQLEKCAEALALRRAFPEMGQTYTDDEMAQSRVAAPESPAASPPPQQPQPKSDSPVEQAQPTEQPNGNNGNHNDSAERQRLVAAFKQIAKTLEVNEAELTTAICRMAGIESLKDADLALIDSKIKILAEGGEASKKRVQKLVEDAAAEKAATTVGDVAAESPPAPKPPPAKDPQVAAVDALASLAVTLGSGKLIFEHLERKFNTRAVNNDTSPEIIRLSQLSLEDLQSELGPQDHDDLPY